MPPWSDLAVLCGIVVSTGCWVARLRRRGLRGGRHVFAVPLSAIAGVAMLLVFWRFPPVAGVAEPIVAVAVVRG